jgi:hypothetical protein
MNSPPVIGLPPVVEEEEKTKKGEDWSQKRNGTVYVQKEMVPRVFM